jgi:hypothetical protein
MPRPHSRSSGSHPVNAERQALEKRAREAAKPTVTEEKGRWPFPVKDAPNRPFIEQNASKARGDNPAQKD